MVARFGLALIVAALAGPAAAQLRVESVERDQIIIVDHDSPEIADAIRKARASLAAFFALADNPRAGMDTFAVKTGLPTRRGTEYVWIREFRRKDGLVRGKIDNTPRWTSRFREGQMISFRESEIIDWLYHDGDKLKGNFISCAMNRMGSAEEAKAIVERFGMTCDE